ncbi:MAG TPA: hypothetical protein VFP01_07365 [Propionibacteriaceae bacterium]|nr:hypothetical protein [Propionibacteriaceae bacterium]
MNGQRGGDPAKLTEAIVTLADSIRTLLLEWRLRSMPVDECTSTKSQPVNSRPACGHRVHPIPERIGYRASEFGFLILSGAETVGLVLARKRRRWITAGRA